MLHGFGQAPVCLEFDLDSFDGPWTHVERFRGRSGWLAVAEATLSGTAGERTTTVIAACDDRGEVFPTWQAEHLLACACSRPTECDDYPPMDLDELLDEAAGELATRWVRENSRALRVLAAKTTEQIAALEAKVRAAVEEADRRDALLRRRRRMTSPGSDAWVALTEAMTAFSLDREAALHHLAERRAIMRREMAAADDAALYDANVEVEWDLLYQVCWSTKGRIGEDRLVEQTQRSSGALRPPMARHHGEAERQAQAAATRRQAAERARTAALAAAQIQAKPPVTKLVATAAEAGEPVPAATPVRINKAALMLLQQQADDLRRRIRLERHWSQDIARKHRLRLAGLRRDRRTMVESTGATDADRAVLTEVAAALDVAEALVSSAGAAPAPFRIVGPPAAPAVPVPASPATSVAQAGDGGTTITATPEALPPTKDHSTGISVVAPAPVPLATSITTTVVPETSTAAAMASSPSARPSANGKLRIERDLLTQQLGELETGGRKYLPGSPKFARNRADRAALSARIRVLTAQTEAEPGASIVAEPSLADQRAELQAELRRHEQRGAKPSDGVNPFGQYRDRRHYLLGRIAELDACIAQQMRKG